MLKFEHNLGANRCFTLTDAFLFWKILTQQTYFVLIPKVGKLMQNVSFVNH